MIQVRPDPHPSGYLEHADQQLLSLIQTSLSSAVPLWGMDLRNKPLDQLMKIAAADGQTIAEKGDVFQFRSKGKTSEAFNAVARGLAALVLVTKQPVRVFGLVFEWEEK